jgi:bacterioferritin-associated ferredoxin
MYVCLCNAVTDRQIRAAVVEGATSMRHLKRELGVASCCGQCAPCARGVLKDELENQKQLQAQQQPQLGGAFAFAPGA